ncbi:MAG: hypothetical protein JRN27_01240 [Nitrososphaerota archaeon]|nr:hypothetical protein [Nitrososphaerota archaeon]MDG6974401.1 hypothetical protein [Nitrososphaerota archaeon]MDG6974707.1 hypothetical protein [Nitrososphaerota archaeon]MDG7009970.1 hypothetical protein [Nitrososphaerota archaeon]MDG7019029.1 hypothetical protein [Nitrososphaerota archaeon]
MPDLGALIRGYAPYFFIVMGVAWLAVAVLGGSVLTAWPVVACFASGVLLKRWPDAGLTFAWAVSTASMGLVFSAYEVYAWYPLLGGAFSSVAAVPVTGFAVFAVAHLFLFYAGLARPVVA